MDDYNKQVQVPVSSPDSTELGAGRDPMKPNSCWMTRQELPFAVPRDLSTKIIL